LTVLGSTNTPTLPGPSRRASPSPPPEDPIFAEYVFLVRISYGHLIMHSTGGSLRSQNAYVP
jgi:hypothetical protein